MNTTAAIRPTNNTTHPERVRQHANPTVAPYVDVFENPNELLLFADVPGATRDGVEVNIEKGRLSVFARRAPFAHSAASNAAKSEASHAAPQTYDYHRVFTVPSSIDATKIEAELNAGVLKLRLPKSEALKPRRIEVKVS